MSAGSTARTPLRAAAGCTSHVNGGFTAQPDGERTRIWHYERYLLPWPVAPLKPLVTAYVRWTQRREMRDFAALIERNQSPAAGE
jgi:hypothetical protein